MDACSSGVVEEASSTSSTPTTTQEETVNVRVVTRSQSRMLAGRQLHDENMHVSESDPQPFDSDSEFERLAAIDVSYVPPVVGVGSVDRDASDADLLQGSDEDEYGAGGEGSAGSDGQLGVSSSQPNCDPLPSADTPSEPCSGSSSADELQLAPPELAEGVNDLKS